MKRLAALTLLLALGCAPQRRNVDTDIEEWRLVLHAKKAALRSDDPAARHAYAARLYRFVQQHPDHVRARQVYDEQELALARELAAKGEYDTALRYIDDVGRRSPNNPRVASQRADTIARRSVNAATFHQLRPGMTQAEVERLLGVPPHGWTQQSADGRYVSWIYRNAAGRAAAVHFDHGRVIATDYDASAMNARETAPR